MPDIRTESERLGRKITLTDIDKIESNRMKTWGEDYKNTHWPNLLRLARIGAKLEEAGSIAGFQKKDGRWSLS